ncbi:MFS transporter [Corynebacterium sp. 335C]
MTQTTTAPAAADPRLHSTREQKKVLTGTLVGTTIEMYDFLIYAQAAALVLAPLFIEPASKANPSVALILAWASIGVAFLFRPLGAVIGGHIGDRYGRKMVLVFSLLGMGSATALIGFLPTYASIGVAAPLLLMLLRIIQGLAAGAEWGGAALMSVENAPDGKRGFYGSFPQLGVPLGMLLATSAMLVTTLWVGNDAYLEWGWRVPFIFSVVLIAIGYVIRRTVDESPVFQQMKAESKHRTAPLPELFRNHWGLVLKAIFIFAGNNAAGFMVIAFFSSYALKTLGMDPVVTMIATIIAGVTWTLFTLWSGVLADRYGRVRVFLIGYAIQIPWLLAIWPFIESGNAGVYTMAIVALTLPLALTYGPTSALFAEMFPAAIRFSGASIGYGIGSIVGGAFAPMIAQILIDSTGKSWTIGVYLAALSLLSIVALVLLPKGIEDRDLHA